MRNWQLTVSTTWILITWLMIRLNICTNFTKETIPDYEGTEEEEDGQIWPYKQTIIGQYFQNLDAKIHQNEKSCCFQSDGECCSEPKYFIHTMVINLTNGTCLISLKASLNITATKIYEQEDIYQIINRCPDEFNTDEDHHTSHCVDDQSDLLSYAVHPVSSLETNLTYINPHCAACNTQNETLMYWQKMMWCKSLDKANTELRSLLSIKNKYVEEEKTKYNCLINHTPPNNVKVRAKQCQPTSQAASSLYELISNTRVRLHIPRKPLPYAYTPVHCRKQEDHYEESNCSLSKKGLEKEIEIHIDEQFLNYTYEDQNQPWDVNDKPSNCPTGFFKNKYLNLCMKRTCGPVKAWHEGRCIFPFTKIKGLMLMYHMNFHFKTHDFNDTIKMKAYHIGNLAVHGFYSVNTTKPTNSCMDSTEVYVQDMGNTVTLQLKLGKAAEYFINIEEEYARFQTTFKKMSKNFNTSLILSNNFLPLRRWPSFPKYLETDAKCSHNIAMSELLFCNGVLFAGFTLSSHENLIINDQIIFLPTEFLEYNKFSQITQKHFVCENLLLQKIKRMKMMQDSVVREAVASNGKGLVQSITFFASVMLSIIV